MLSYFKKARNLFLRKIIFRKHEIGPNFHAGRQVFLYAKNKIKIGNLNTTRDFLYVEDLCAAYEKILKSNK